MTYTRLQRRTTEAEKERFPCCLTLHDIENNHRTRAWFTQKGAELWYDFARRGYAMLLWNNHPTDGYYYKLSDIKTAMQKFWDEGLIKKGGYFYEERYYL